MSLNSGIKTELSTTTRAGIGRFTYPASTQSNMIIKVNNSEPPVSATTVNVVGNNEITGSVTSNGFCEATNPFTLYFAVTFDHNFTGTGSYSGGEYVTFDTTSNQQVQARVGISHVSVANAQANVDAEIPAYDFASVKSAAYAAWNAKLKNISIAGGTSDQQHTFYTALYHSMIHPNVFSDTNGQYLGEDNKVHTVASGHAQYATFSNWDTYRTQSQLIAMVAPAEASDIATSMLNDYAQVGTFPKWGMNNAETYIMVGDPGPIVLADYYAFGARNFDTSAALAAMKTESSTTNNVRPGNDYLDSFGYLPTDSHYGCCHEYATVSTQLEYDSSDFAISAFAGALGDTATQTKLQNRAQNWKNIFNYTSGWIQPQHSNGRWMTGFVNSPISGGTNSNDFAEGDSLIYTGMIPFNVAGAAAAEGGNAAWNKYLDKVLSGYTGLSSLIGLQSNMGNEPSIGLPWEYDYVGKPYKTQQVVRAVQDQIWTNTPGGLAGNDDLGTMSAWYVWSAMGMYPETPGTADLALGSPLFSQVTVTLGNGKTISINAPAAADNAPYVQSLNVNGVASNNAYLPASAVINGATLDYTLGTSANTSWAATTAPPSYDGTATPILANEKSGAVTSGFAGKCIDDAKSGTSNGNTIQLYKCNGTSAQTLKVVPDETLQVFDKCLDVKDSGTANGTAVQLYVCNGTTAQQWKASDNAIVNVNSGKCLDVTGSAATDGAALEINDCNATTSQQWSLPS